MRAMGELLPYRTPRSREDWTAYLGMVIFLASWAMLFASLFFAYGVVRARTEVWPPDDLPPAPVAWGAVNTAILALSGAAIQLALFSVRRGRARTVAPGIAASAILGAIFLALQIASWAQSHAAGLTPDAGPYASVFYGLTWFHALHVAVGVVALAWLAARAFQGRFTPARHRGIRLWAMYWHFVGIIWALMFVLVYLV
jgi:heme/copper-type cytochrome/quinol oxidase subunit 3